MARRIIMAVTNDLLTDQRVDRSCRALKEAGYEVTLVGRRLRHAPVFDHPSEEGRCLALEERPYRCVRMRLLFRRSAWFYAEYNLRLLLRLLVVKADAFYANDSDTLPACCRAARLRRKRLLFDAHELFPDVPELVGKPRVRKVWKWVERRCLPRVDAAFTVSQSVADEYRRRYGVAMTVVRNLPMGIGDGEWKMDNGLPHSDYSQLTEDSAATESNSQFLIRNSQLILYQGTVNVGRGVRELIDVMGRLPQCQLVVAGDGDLLEELRAYAARRPWAERIVFLGRVRPERLHLLTKEADLGVCLLEDLGESYRCALPNRVGDFAQAGVPMVATGFVEIRRVLEDYGIGTVTEPCPKVKEGEAYSRYLGRLANTIEGTLQRWQAMPEAEREQRFARARKELCWENEKKGLLEKINAIF